MISINNVLVYDSMIDRISTNFNVKDSRIIGHINFVIYRAFHNVLRDYKHL
jgi:hypothetical protein